MSTDDFKALKEAKKESIKIDTKDLMQYAVEQIEALGYEVYQCVGKMCLYFEYKDQTVTFYPYKGWATGKSIKDGRGIKNLIKQIKE
jgi:sporulation-control protein spo0M